MIRAQVIVRPRASIFDPQGDAVQRAIQHLGISAIKQAHVGKFIELELDTADVSATRTQLETICKDLLSNPVIEDYILTLLPGPGGATEQRVTMALKKAKAVVAKTTVKNSAKPKKAAKSTVKIHKLKKARKK